MLPNKHVVYFRILSWMQSFKRVNFW